MQQGSTPGSTQPGGSAGYARDIAERAGSAVSRMTETAQATASRLSDAASDAAQRLSARSEELMELQGRVTETARVYVRQHPLVTVGIVIAIGMLLARLTSRR